MQTNVHYINNGKNGIYGKDVFIKEAKALGVSRAFSANTAKRIKFGDKIYLAIFEKKQKGKDWWISGQANIFGYFVVSGMNITGDASIQALCPNIPPLINQKVTRSCGSYNIKYAVKTHEQLETLIDALNAQGKNYKLFLTGEYHDYTASVPANFNRGLYPVDIPDLDTSVAIEQCIAELREITDYVRV